MKKAHSLIGLNLVAKSGGEALGTVRDLIFDSTSNELLALVLSEKDLFGLVQAQVVPWREVVKVGDDAIIVQSAASKIKAGSDQRLTEVVQRETTLGGTRLMTTDGQEIGTLGDVFIDENTGRITGYEISGGFISDTLHGKRFLPAMENVQIGKDVAFVPPEATAQIEETARKEGSWQQKTASASERFSHLAGNARTKAETLYENVATTSATKQEVWVTGRTAARDVRLPGEAIAPSAAASEGSEFLVRAGDVITPETAERARELGLLGNLTMVAVESAATNAYSSGKEKLLGATSAPVASSEISDEMPTEKAPGPLETMQNKAASAAVGKTAGRTVLRPDGEVLIAPGQVITEIVLAQARQCGKENEVIASAGLGAAQAGVESAKTQASQLWATLKGKAEELGNTAQTAAQTKKNEVEDAALQKRIAEVVGQPATRLILDRSDQVIVSQGDIITYAAVERAREAGALDVLLNSAAVNDILPLLPFVVEEAVVTDDSSSQGNL